MDMANLLVSIYTLWKAKLKRTAEHMAREWGAVVNRKCVPLTHYIIWRELPLQRCDGVGLISDDARKEYTDCAKTLIIYICAVNFNPMTQPKMFSVQFSHSVVSDSLRPHGLQHARLLWACSNSCPSNQWCHPTVSSSVVPFSSCLQSFPASGSFPVSQFLASGGQNIGVSASISVLPINI